MIPIRGLLAPNTDCQIRNISNFPIKMIPKSYPDAAGSRGMVREKLVLVIQPQSSVDVDSRRYDLNGTNCYVQMKIHFVRDEIPTEDGKVQLKHNAAYPDGIEVATGELFFLHYELKAKGQMYLACGEEGKVTEVFIKQSTMTMHQNKEMNRGITGFFR
ncbi:hypothetical protein BT93_E1160 [Corymbia citriodora subsp. variegata]|nr:hypothetical protein BT93_E1160 [Corymbia citriodora subsp. variegata]